MGVGGGCPGRRSGGLLQPSRRDPRAPASGVRRWPADDGRRQHMCSEAYGKIRALGHLQNKPPDQDRDNARHAQAALRMLGGSGIHAVRRRCNGHMQKSCEGENIVKNGTLHPVPGAQAWPKSWKTMVRRGFLC